MIAKIGRSANLYGALAYNQLKVENENGQILFANKIIETASGHYSVAQLAQSFAPYLIANRNTEKDAQAGDVKFIDINKDGSINEDDKKYSGSGIPKIEINFNLGAEYHGFDFSAVVGSAWGHKLYNGNKYSYEGMNSGSNFLKSSLDAWTPSNKKTSVPRAVYQDPNGNLKESTRFLEKGDFIRLRQIQLGDSFPSSWLDQIAIERIRLYMSGENLITITDYDGIDPEFSRESVLNTGIDTFIYPFTRSYTVGIQVTF